jgi:photosystem II stability/assembly factor-like uncharacterized protein
VLRRLIFLLCLLLVGCGSSEPEDPWQVIELGTDASFRDIFFLDQNNGWMVGEVGVSVPGGIVARTTDGGLTWSYRTGVIGKRSRTHSVDMNAVHFIDLQHGIIAAEAGTIMRTEDGGETWKRIPPTGPVYAQNQDISFVDEMNGWIIGRQGARRTEDGGASWKRVDEEGKLTGRTLQFLDLNRGWVAGKFGDVRRTDDGGVTWEKVDAAGNLEGLSGDDKPNFQSLHFPDENHGWIVGYRREMPELEQYDFGLVYHTSDGGKSWSKQLEWPDILLRSVRFADARRGWAVGNNVKDGTSTVLATENGGKDWFAQTVVYGEELLAVFELDGFVWAVGDRVREEPQKLLRLVPDRVGEGQ